MHIAHRETGYLSMPYPKSVAHITHTCDWGRVTFITRMAFPLYVFRLTQGGFDCSDDLGMPLCVREWVNSDGGSAGDCFFFIAAGTVFSLVLLLKKSTWVRALLKVPHRGTANLSAP